LWIRHRNLRRLRLQVGNRSAGRARQLLRLRNELQLVVKAGGDALHEQIRDGKSLRPIPFGLGAENASDRHVLRHWRHMAGLTGTLRAKITMPPFLIGHLLGQRSDDLAVWSARLREERMAAGT